MQNNFANPEQKKFYYIKRMMKMVNIGAAVEAECQMRWYESQNGGLYNSIKQKYWLAATGTRQKQNVMRLLMNRKDYQWDTWSAALRARIGGWLLDVSQADRECLAGCCNFGCIGTTTLRNWAFFVSRRRCFLYCIERWHFR